MGRFPFLFPGLAGLIALGCGLLPEDYWMRESKVASIECRVENYTALLPLNQDRYPEERLYGTTFTLTGEDCPFPEASTSKRGLNADADHMECKGQAEALYWRTFDNAGYVPANDLEREQLEKSIAGIAPFHCYPEGETEDLPEASAIPTSTPAPPTPTPELSYRRIPEGYPYTINVPSHWSASVKNANGLTEHAFQAPDSEAASIGVLSASSPSVWPFGAESFADTTLAELERGAVEGTFQLISRTTLPDGGIKMFLSYQEWPGCHLNSVALIQLLPRRVFIVEGGACKNGWDEYADLLIGAVDSFTVKSTAWR